MAIFDRIREAWQERKMQKRLDTVVNVYDETDSEKEAVRKATEKVIELIKSHPNMPAIDLLEMIQEEENLPTEIVVESTKQIPEVRSEETAVKIVEKLDLSSKGIQEIVQDADVSIDAAEEMIKQIPNKEIQEKEMEKIAELKRQQREEKRKKEEEEKRQQTEKYKKQLKDVYVKCDEKSMQTLISELKEIRDNNDSIELQNIMRQIFARKVAIEWKQFGSARVPSINQVIPVEEMMEHDFSKLVGEEFEDIKDVDKYPGDKEYSEDELQEQILKEIAKNVARTYDELGIIDIPQSETMTHISKAQEIFFIDQIETYSGEIEDIERVQRQIRGIKGYNEDDLINMFRKMQEDEKEYYVKELKRQMMQRKQNKFSPKLEQKFLEVHEKMEGLNEQDSIEILEETIENIEEIKKEKGRRTKENDTNVIKNDGTTKSDDDDEITH